jgi:hypothetical protein
MNRSTEITKVIEGFKLGSLGVSRKPKVTDMSDIEPELQPKPAEPSEFDTPVADTVMGSFGPKRKHNVVGRRIDWIVGTTGKPTSDFVTGIRWKESNENKFLMVCYERMAIGTDNYFIEVRGGLNIKLVSKISIANTGSADFRALYTFQASGRKEADQKVHDLAVEITKAGSFGYALATGKLGSGWDAAGGKWQNYIWETARVLTSPYFT